MEWPHDEPFPLGKFALFLYFGGKRGGDQPQMEGPPERPPE